MKLIIFDVCWTMYKSNTTFDFVKFVYKEKNIRSFRLFFLNLLIVKFAIILLGRLLGHDVYREIFVLLLKGFKHNELESLSSRFYLEFLRGKKIDYTFELFEKLDPNEIILCSASIDIVVGNIAKELNVGFFASELEFRNDICTGKIGKDLLGKKNTIFENKEIKLVVTDNISDLNLVKKSSEYVILSTLKNVKYWEKHGFTVNYLIQD